jgi:hypothetical protein
MIRSVTGWWQRNSERMAGLVMAVSALATAWSGYQASLWSGKQAAQYNLSTQYRTDAARANDDAARQRLLDIMFFAKWLEANAEHRSEVTSIYELHFMPEFRPAFDAWRQSADTAGQLTPFQLSQYHVQRADDAARLDSAANRALRAGDAASETGDGYVFITVILANVLFFAGAIRPLVSSRIRGGVIALAIALCVAGLVRLFLLPVAR